MDTLKTTFSSPHYYGVILAGLLARSAASALRPRYIEFSLALRGFYAIHGLDRTDIETCPAGRAFILRDRVTQERFAAKGWTPFLPDVGFVLFPEVFQCG